ncbi:hypothetical protein ACFYMW_34540 [Streptomyces sp. NPDC006692]|uniref:hypothetical protein n=1 Tax=Streptomyces sp. NPDC006692 TaxID=3364758 RepID=UPI00367AA37A
MELGFDVAPIEAYTQTGRYLDASYKRLRDAYIEMRATSVATRSPSSPSGSHPHPHQPVHLGDGEDRCTTHLGGVRGSVVCPSVDRVPANLTSRRAEASWDHLGMTPALPRTVRAVDTARLRNLAQEAAIHGFSQRLPVDWLREHLAADATHYLFPTLVQRLTHRPETPLRRRTSSAASSEQ